MRYIALPLILFSSHVTAEPVIRSAVTDYSSDIFKVVLSLAFVLFIFYIGALLFKKYLTGPLHANSSMKIVGGMSLTSKDKLLIVEVCGVNLLLGVSSNGITKIHAFDEELLQEKVNQKDDSNTSFSTHLSRLLNNKTL